MRILKDPQEDSIKPLDLDIKKTQEGAKEDLTHGCFKDPRII